MNNISVVMSTYNEEVSQLRESIESILNQTHKEFEFIIIVDNPKNDEIIRVLEEYSNKDNRIKIIKNEENIGLAASLNKGMKEAKGKYIARMDADDIALPNRFEKEYIFLEENSDIDIVSSNVIFIDNNDKVIGGPKYLPKNDEEIKKILKYNSPIHHPSVMFRKDKINEIGNYRLFPASQDYDLWLRASYYNLKFAILNEKLLKYRIRDNNISNSNHLKQYALKQYIQKLYKERIKKGTDSFSIDNLNKYLEKEKVFDKKNIEKFDKGSKYLNSFKDSIKNKKIISAIKYFFKAIFSHKKIIFDLVDNAIMYKIKKQ